MKNKLVDLNTHLFLTIERLNEENIKVEDLEKEIKRAEAIAKVSAQIIESSNLSLKAAHLIAEYGGDINRITAVIDGNGNHPAIDRKQIESKAR